MAKLEVTEDQLRLIQQALDMYSRVGGSQFRIILEHPTYEKSVYRNTVADGKDDWEAYHNIKDKALDYLTLARNTLTGENIPKNGSWGIYNEKVDESCRVAWDIQQKIRHEFWKINPNRSDMTVDSSVHLSTEDGHKIKVEL